MKDEDGLRPFPNTIWALLHRGAEVVSGGRAAGPLAVLVQQADP